MIIDNLLITTDLMTIIQELKRQLANAGIQRFSKITDGTTDIMVCCPYHKDGQERRPSAGIRKSDGMFHCLACGETHSLSEMISNCFGYTDTFGSYGHKWLAQNFANAEIEEREDIELDLERISHIDKRAVIRDNNISSGNSEWNSGAFVSEEELKSYRYIHKYMYERRLTDDIIDFFDIGYDARNDSITFPVKDKLGNCIFVARRNVHRKHFTLPRGIEKPLYGLYEVCQKGLLVQAVDEVYVCEGLFDCLRLWCNGKYAVAGFGCLFSDYQINQLQSLPVRKLILALDNDKAGREAERVLLDRIRNKIITKVVLPKHRKDIGECTDDEIQNLEEVF